MNSQNKIILITGATSGIGILRETTSGVLKVQLEALQNEGLTKIISNPKLFSALAIAEFNTFKTCLAILFLEKVN